MARNKNKFAFPIGIIAVILAIVGLVTVINFSVRFVKSKTEHTAQKAEYEQMLKPVVMFDPNPFDDLTKADNSQLLYAAVWALLMDEEGVDKYSYSTGETIGIVVPQTDIEKYFTELFGNEIDIASLHSSIDMSAYDISYDAALKSYILPITGVDSAYIPEVESIKKQGTSVILNVGYIGSKAWADISGENATAPEPDKYMTVTLRERNGGMYIAAIQAAEGMEIVAERTTSPAYYEEIPEETSGEVTTEEQTTEESEIQFENVTDENGENITDEYGEQVTRKITVEENTGVAPETETSEIELDPYAY